MRFAGVFGLCLLLVGCARHAPAPQLTTTDRPCAVTTCPGEARYHDHVLPKVCFQLDQQCAKAQFATSVASHHRWWRIWVNDNKKVARFPRSADQFCRFAEGCGILSRLEVLMPGESLDPDPEDEPAKDVGKKHAWWKFWAGRNNAEDRD